ncbi:MAG: hypothetical protein GWN00_02415 [Aliifodinibius sp.]|nr:hypothetical protein [Fodinibius sp.]NIV09775.1 hypothetical protein [Fodinibius sp.]NIY23712.1 hypothetical protein [Fodinibius sp.]
MQTNIKTFVGQNVDNVVNNWLAANEGKKIDEENEKEIETTVLDIKVAAAAVYDSDLNKWVTEVVVTIIYRRKEEDLT